MVLQKDKRCGRTALQTKIAYVSGPVCSMVIQGYICEGVNVCVCYLGVNERYDAAEIIADCCRYFPWQKWVKKPRECVRRFADYACEELQDRVEDEMRKGARTEARNGARSETRTETPYGLLICVGDAVSLYGNSADFYLIQSNLGRGHMEKIAIPFEGKMEPGAMILLADTRWFGGAEDRISELERILYIEGERTEERMTARLQEAHSNMGGAVLFALEVAANET